MRSTLTAPAAAQHTHPDRDGEGEIQFTQAEGKYGVWEHRRKKGTDSKTGKQGEINIQREGRGEAGRGCWRRGSLLEGAGRVRSIRGLELSPSPTASPLGSQVPQMSAPSGEFNFRRSCCPYTLCLLPMCRKRSYGNPLR